VKFCSFKIFPSQEENDDNYEEEQDAGDEFDSDFGEDVRYGIYEPPSIQMC
jgi:hypothetical protein